MKPRPLFAVLCLLCGNSLPAAAPPPISDARVQELQNLRWGMFVCWSFSTFSGKEWTPGVTNVSFFKAIRGEIQLPPPPISRGKPAKASSVWKSQRGFDVAAAFDGDHNTRWGAAEKSRCEFELFSTR